MHILYHAYQYDLGDRFNVDACDVSQAVRTIEQGHVRVGPTPITDPALMITRNMEDFITWVDGSKVQRQVMKYREKLDDFDLL